MTAGRMNRVSHLATNKSQRKERERERERELLTCEILVLEIINKDAGKQDKDTSGGRYDHGVDVRRVGYDDLEISADINFERKTPKRLDRKLHRRIIRIDKSRLTLSQLGAPSNVAVLFASAVVERSSISQKVGFSTSLLRLSKFSMVVKSCGCQRRRVFKL